MAHNGPILVYYDGRIIALLNGMNYDPPEPAYILENTTVNRGYYELCNEIFENIDWSCSDDLIIRDRFSSVQHDNMLNYRLLKITNDAQWIKFAEHVRRVGVELEIYVDRVQNKQSQIGMSS